MATANPNVNRRPRQSRMSCTSGMLESNSAQQDPDDEQPERAGGKRQQHALGHELSDDSAPRGAEREAHRDLPAARDRKAGQQRAHVRARDQQNEQRNQQARRRGRLRPASRPTAGSSCRRAAARRPWTARDSPARACVCCAERARDRLDRWKRLIDLDPRLQTRDKTEECRVVAGQGRGGVRCTNGRAPSGSHTRTCEPPVLAPANRRGATPTIVTGTSFTFSVLPTTSGARPKYRSHTT